MKIALIGATGFVGSHILKEALSRGHEITAVVRKPGEVGTFNEQLHIVQGDVFNTKELSDIFKGHDIVISAYNVKNTDNDYHQRFLSGSESIQEAAKLAGVKRLIVSGGAGSLEIKPGLQLVDSSEFPEEYKPIARAARDYFTELEKEQELDWTFVSPAIEMHPGIKTGRTGKYRTGYNQPVFDEHRRSRISPEDLAVAIIDEVENHQFSRKRFTIAY
jgi:putative NADH-flavin reductase